MIGRTAVPSDPPSLAQRHHDFDDAAPFRRRLHPGRPTPWRTMSRRHHGRARHGRSRTDDVAHTPASTDARPAEPVERRPAIVGFDSPAASQTAAPEAIVGEMRPTTNGHEPARPAQSATGAEARDLNGDARAGCTAPQLRRFIKSRPYVPMHELRRRFGINGVEDDVSALPIDEANVYVGLPERECRLLGELVRGGEVGYELSLDPRTPIVVGVYPMRPVPRA